MIFLKIISGIFLILFMVLTLVCFFVGAVKEMCFFGIFSIWFLIDLVHTDIIDKLK